MQAVFINHIACPWSRWVQCICADEIKFQRIDMLNRFTLAILLRVFASALLGSGQVWVISGFFSDFMTIRDEHHKGVTFTENPCKLFTVLPAFMAYCFVQWKFAMRALLTWHLLVMLENWPYIWDGLIICVPYKWDDDVYWPWIGFPIKLREDQN